MNPKDQSLDDYLRILVVISNPLGSLEGNVLTIPKYSLDVAYEWQLIEESIEKNRDDLTRKYPAVAFVKVNPPTKEEIQIKLSPKFKYQVLHFIGHGNAMGIEVENEIGISYSLATQDLVSMVESSALQFVFLNSCNSTDIGRELIDKTQIKSVIATEDSVDNQIASYFAGKFYSQLANGKGAESAFTLARAETKERFNAYPPYSLIGNKNWSLDYRQEADKPIFLYMDPPNNLPLGYLGKHTCRSGEMIGLVRASEKSRKVFNIAGISGIGKSTFALKYAQRYSSRYGDGIVYLDMGSAKGNKEILLTFAGFIDKIDKHEIARTITDGSYLILIDNLEEAEAQQYRYILDFLALINWQITRSALFILSRRRYDKNELLYADTLILQELKKDDIIAWLDKEYPNILRDLRDSIDEFIEITHGHPKIIQLAINMFAYLSAKDVLSRLRNFEGKDIESLITNIMNEILRHEDNKLRMAIMNVLALSGGRARAKLIRYCIRETSDRPLNNSEIDFGIEALFKLNYLRYYKILDTYVLHPLLVSYFKNTSQQNLGCQMLDKIRFTMQSYLVSEIHGPFVFTSESENNYVSLFNWVAGARANEFSTDFKQQWIDNYLLTLYYHNELEIRMLSGAGLYRRFTFQEVNKALNMEDRAAWLINPFKEMKELFIFRDILHSEYYKNPEIQIGYYDILMAKVHFAYESYFKLRGLAWERRVNLGSGTNDIVCNFRSMLEMINEIIKKLLAIMSGSSIICTESFVDFIQNDLGFKIKLNNSNKIDRIWDEIIQKYQNVINSHGLKIEASYELSNCQLIICFPKGKTPFQATILDHYKKNELRKKYGL